jgi:CheY-like chemotaxis protein
MMESKRPHYMILIAEDDEDDYILMRDAFMEFCVDSDLFRVKDGEELMEYLHHEGKFIDAEEYPRPGIILLDLNMPRKDGREALKEIKSDPELANIPVVALTTSSAEDDIHGAYRMGVNSYIRKPSAYGEFVDIMKVFQHYWHDVVKLPD